MFSTRRDMRHKEVEDRRQERGDRGGGPEVEERAALGSGPGGGDVVIELPLALALNSSV